MSPALTYAPGEPVRIDTRTAQRPPMTTADARAMSGITHLEAAQ